MPTTFEETTLQAGGSARGGGAGWALLDFGEFIKKKKNIACGHFSYGYITNI